MQKPLRYALLALALIAPLSASAQVAWTGPVGGVTPVNTPVTPKKNVSWNCSAGNFTGYIQGVSWSDGSGTYFKVEKYKITDNGRKKGNLNLTLGRHRSNSADNLKQDGQWHTINQQVGGYIHPLDQYDRNFKFQFIFDRKMASDPKCTGTPR